MKKVVFLMPFSGRVPVGGFKVVYEYANRLAADGYTVSVVYPATRDFAGLSFMKKCRELAKFLYRGITDTYKCKGWFRLDPRVKEHWVWSLSKKSIPRGDLFVATAIETAQALNQYDCIPDRAKFYLIQHFEAWNYTLEEVIATYHYPMRKIVIAEWLEQIVRENGEECTLIHNGFDFDYFSKSIDFPDKDKFRVVMLYHTSLWKGCADGFKALEVVKAKYPQLEVNLFGVYPRPAELPEWYRYYQKPDKETHNRIYNEAALFLGPSHGEGFCLTPPEAMQCGCAVVCTDIGGYTVVCKAGETALVSPPGEPNALAANLLRLMEDDALRLKIAKKGYDNIRNFTWDKAYEKFRREIEA